MQKHYAAYDGVTDLYVYFFEQGLQQRRNQPSKRELSLQEKNDWEATLDKARTSTVLHTNTIAACEQAIDKMVYQLFDLTADEIAVVEG